MFASTDSIDLDAVIDHAGDAVCVADRNMVFKAANRRFSLFHGFSDPRDLLGKSAFETYPGFRSSVFFEVCEAAVRTARPVTQVGFSSKFNDWVIIRCMPFGDDTMMVVQKFDDSRIKSIYAARHDPLTSLPSRTAFENDCANLPAFALPVAAIAIDILHLRHLNESLGTPAGDRCLMEMASRLRANLPSDASTYRLGDDEFLVVSSDPGLVAEDRLARLLEAMEQPFRLEADAARQAVRVTLGACRQEDAHNATEACARAIASMAQTRDRRLGRIVHEQNTVPLECRPTLLHEMQQACATGQFVVHLQPQVDLSDGRVCGAEALIRWNHPTRGLLAPDSFLPFAEEMDFVDRLDRAAFTRTLEALQDNLRHGVRVPVAFNLSAQSLCSPDIVAFCRAALSDSGVDASLLCVEITETAMMADIERSRQVVQDLKATGMTVAIDDFGSGYSSMAYLMRYPSRFLKVDREFIRDLDTDENRQVMVGNIVRMAGGLGITTIAEGVETAAQEAALGTLGCSIAQGYRYARPLPPAEFLDYARSRGTSSAKAAVR